MLEGFCGAKCKDQRQQTMIQIKIRGANDYTLISSMSYFLIELWCATHGLASNPRAGLTTDTYMEQHANETAAISHSWSQSLHIFNEATISAIFRQLFILPPSRSNLISSNTRLDSLPPRIRVRDRRNADRYDADGRGHGARYDIPAQTEYKVQCSSEGVMKGNAWRCVKYVLTST